ncbi:MAG: ABC transporter permease [Burkholderiales bacterium]|nr:MAG: ABC transporter permease [Burkholderiales bacterium]
MNLLATFRVALKAIRVNALRSTLTMLGIIIGVAAVITMIGVGAGAQSRVEEQMRALGSNVIIVLPGSMTSGGRRLGSGSVQTLTEDDARAIALEVPEVQAAGPSMRGAAQLVFGNANWSTAVYGVTNDYFEVRDWTLAAGRWFEASELAGAGKVAIIGQSAAEQLFGEGFLPETVVDQTIRVRKLPVTIVGVMGRKGQSAMGSDQDDVLFLPLNTARSRLLGAGQGAPVRRVGAISVKVREGEDMEAAEDKMRALLRQRHRLQPGQEDDFFIRNLTELLQAREESSRAMAYLLAAIASVSLLVGGIGIMNIMLVSVTERTREIGLRMAVGARARDILSQFLVEAVTLSSIGGIAGIVLGLAATELLGRLAGWRVELRFDAVLLAFGFAALVGVFFGFYPARKAAALEPIEALRYE